jgi:hypothetical protein
MLARILEGLGGQLAAGIAVDAGGIDEKLTHRIFLNPLFPIGHSDLPF